MHGIDRFGLLKPLNWFLIQPNCGRTPLDKKRTKKFADYRTDKDFVFEVNLLAIIKLLFCNRWSQQKWA
jgi:hypothetical protein